MRSTGVWSAIPKLSMSAALIELRDSVYLLAGDHCLSTYMIIPLVERPGRPNSYRYG